MTNNRLLWSLSMLLAVSTACADRTAGEEDSETSGPEPGELYGECLDIGDCFDEWCVHPAGEPGFCTYPCSMGCEVSLSGSATETCLQVDDEEVCALDCAGGKTCPAGMRCEQIDAGGEPRSICF